MALAWVLRQPAMTSVLIGASRVEQIENSIGSLAHLEFTNTELTSIEHILRN